MTTSETVPSYPLRAVQKGMLFHWLTCALITVFAFTVAACDRTPAPATGQGDVVGQQVATRSLAQRIGTVFTDTDWDSLGRVAIEEVPLPAVAGAESIWGALGSDDRGHVWFAVSGADAHLYEWDPASHGIIARGDAAGALADTGQQRQGEQQGKIHSHLQQADDGYLYFTSMDDNFEDWRTGTTPRWGSHLWRIRPETGHWEHVFAAPEGLVALNATGRWVYALGYWNNVLYQYDTLTAKVHKQVVGSACGHVSRNFVVDLHGHVYVPRLESLSADPDKSCRPEAYRAVLVELDTHLQEVSTQPLDGYLSGQAPAADHGIIAFAKMADGTIAFTTHSGHLYHVIAFADAPALVMSLGDLHPAGPAYTASLFSVDGKGVIAGVSLPRAGGTGEAEWLRYELHSGRAAVARLATPPHRAILLYGSMARDANGDFFTGGRIQEPSGRMRPVLFRIRLVPGT